MSEPVLVGLMFADRVITEKNNKKGIIGTFNRFIAQKFPASFPPWSVYAGVTNITGEHEFALNLVADNTQQVVAAISGKFGAEREIDVVELDPMLTVSFPHPGTYILTFVVDGQQIGARVLLVEMVRQAGG